MVVRKTFKSAANVVNITILKAFGAFFKENLFQHFTLL